MQDQSFEIEVDVGADDMHNKHEYFKRLKQPIRIQAVGQLFITGMSSQYSTEFPKELQGVIDKQKYVELINGLNEKIQDYWPCTFCHYFGWVLAPFTCGLSFYFPRICIKDATRLSIARIEYYNISELNHRGIHMELKLRCYTSWIEIRNYDGGNKRVPKINDDV